MKIELTNSEMELFLNPFTRAITTAADSNAKLERMKEKLSESETKIQDATVKVQNQYETLIKEHKLKVKESDEKCVIATKELAKKTEEMLALNVKLEKALTDLVAAQEAAKGQVFWKNVRCRVSELMIHMQPKNDASKLLAVNLVQSLVGTTDPQEAIDIVNGSYLSKKENQESTLIDALRKNLSPDVIPAHKLNELQEDVAI